METLNVLKLVGRLVDVNKRVIVSERINEGKCESRTRAKIIRNVLIRDVSVYI